MKLPSGLEIEKNAALAPFTSWLVGGSADHLAQPKTIDQLKEAVAYGKAAGLPITILGGGTNVLVSDKGVRGLVIALRKLAGSTLTTENGITRIECLAGTSKSELLKHFLKQKLEPALFLAGLPGDVGGGIVMNAGVGEKMVPREFVEITEWIEVLRWDGAEQDLRAVSKTNGLVGTKANEFISEGQVLAAAASMRLERIEAKALQWSYRHCEGWRPGIIARVGLSWPHEPKDDILPRVKQANQVRLSKQPLDMPSCGSVFINPPGHTSGRLIEQSGLKGFAVGGAKVSEKHANFIVNFEKAKASDIHQVIEHVKKTVREKQGVELRTEVVYLGEWG